MTLIITARWLGQHWSRVTPLFEGWCLAATTSLWALLLLGSVQAAEEHPIQLHRIDHLVTVELTERSGGILLRTRASIGVDNDGARSHLLLAIPSHAIPVGEIVAATLYLYVDEITADWFSGQEIRGYRLRDAITDGTLHGGWFTGSANAAHRPSWDWRGRDPQNERVHLKWLGLPGASQEGVDFTSWSDGDPVLSLTPRSWPGYRAMALPPAWLARWRDIGENRGILLKLKDEVHQHGLAAVSLEDSQHPPFVEISSLPTVPGPVQTRVIANDAIANATWPPNSFKVASRAGRTFVAYTRQDRHWATLWREADGIWNTGWASDDETPETPLLLMDATGYLHVFANTPNVLMLRHYRSLQPLSVQAFDSGEDVVVGPSHFGGAIGPDGTIYLAYLENGTYDIKIAVQRPLMTDWHIITVVKSDCKPGRERCGHYPAIRVDAQNNIHLTYDIVRLADYVHTLVAYAFGHDHGEHWYRSDGRPHQLPISDGSDEAVSEPSDTYLAGGQILLSRCGSVHVLYHRRRVDSEGNISSRQEVIDARHDATGWSRSVIGVGGRNNTGVLAADFAGRLYAVFDQAGQIVSYESSDDGANWANPRVLATRSGSWPQTPTLWFPSTKPALQPGEPLEFVFTGIHEYGEIYFSSLIPDATAATGTCQAD